MSAPETDVDDDDGEDTEEDTDARHGDEYGQGDARGKGTCETETMGDLEQSASTANYSQPIIWRVTLADPVGDESLRELQHFFEFLEIKKKYKNKA